MTRSSFPVIAAAALLGIAAPAFADSGTPRMTLDARTRTFCTIDDAITGSRIGTRECHTAADWAKQGLTVSAATKVASR